MAGYVIHIAVAQEFLRKNKENYNEEFIRGSILPDLTNDKSKTHYGKSPAYTNLKKFLLENELSNNLNRGKFIHLITDYLFYNYYLDKFSKEYIYDDYDKSNKKLLEKYNIKILEEVKNSVFYKTGEMKILTYPLIYRLIDEISDLNLEQVKEEIMQDNKKWNYYKKII